MRRSKGTEIESCYLLPLGKTSWPSKVDITKEDRATTMDIEMQAKPPAPPLPIPKMMSPKDAGGGTSAPTAHPDFIQRYYYYVIQNHRKRDRGNIRKTEEKYF